MIGDPDRNADWALSGPAEVAPGVHRIPLPLPMDGLRAVNVYAIEDAGGIVLIDSGSPHPDCASALEQRLATIGASLEDVSLVIATHTHYDHYGLTSMIRSRAGASIALGEHELALLRVALEQSLYEGWIQQRRRWLERHGAGAILADMERFEDNVRREVIDGIGGGTWEPPDRVLADGERVRLRDRTLEVRWTPGHTRGHVMLFDADNALLFAGDHVLPHITPSLGFEPFADGRALELFLASLAATRDLPAELVLPGHGPAFEGLERRVDELLAHHQRRLESCVEVISGEGARSAHAVARRLTWTSRDRAFGELDPLNRVLAVTETVTHLELLVRHGRLAREGAPNDAVAYGLAA